MNWYCIHTRPLKEQQVTKYLRHTVKVETYFPRLRRQRTIRRVRRTVINPLFPRYLFCRIDPAESYRFVRYAPDVVDFVHVGEHPAIVRDELIDDLKSWTGATGEIITAPDELRNGDTVEVTDGPMRGLTTVILRASDDRDRVAILLSTLQFGAELTISRTQLRRVSAALPAASQSPSFP